MHYWFFHTDGSNRDFAHLCHMLDGDLNEMAGGEENRSQYICHNTLETIYDVLLIYADDTPVGCASFRFYEPGAAEVKRVFIKKEYRGQGLARQLMTELEAKAHAKGFGTLVLETGAHMTSALALYQQMGYQVIENYGPYKDMEESVCLQKHL